MRESPQNFPLALSCLITVGTFVNLAKTKTNTENLKNVGPAVLVSTCGGSLFFSSLHLKKNLNLQNCEWK
jgi:hypothetical protein